MERAPESIPLHLKAISVGSRASERVSLAPTRFVVVTHDIDEFLDLAVLVEPLTRFEVRVVGVSEWLVRMVFRVYAPSRDGAAVVVYEEDRLVPRYVGEAEARELLSEWSEIAEKLGAKPGRLEVA